MAMNFGATSEADQVLEGVDLRDRCILVTGVSAAIGVETARALAAHGANVIGTARDLEKAGATTGQVLVQAAPEGGLRLVELDLASLASVRACADALLAAGQPLDLIIANAGVMACPKGTTTDGFETQFGTNHLGHFVLVNRIASLLQPGGRVVMVSSAGHRGADIDLEDPGFERTPYDKFTAYRRSKTATILFAVEFDRRHKFRGITATAVHPGAVRTETTKRLIESMGAGQGSDVPAYHWKTVSQGAATSVWAGIVASAEQVGAQYCEDCHLAEIDDNTDHAAGVRSYALDIGRAKALWAKSEEMVGERF